MNITTVTSKGQVVIPAALRKKYKIKKGIKLSVIDKGNKIILQPLTEEYYENMAGILNTKGSLEKAIINERSKDKEIEIPDGQNNRCKRFNGISRKRGRL